MDFNFHYLAKKADGLNYDYGQMTCKVTHILLQLIGKVNKKQNILGKIFL